MQQAEQLQQVVQILKFIHLQVQELLTVTKLATTSPAPVYNIVSYVVAAGGGGSGGSINNIHNAAGGGGGGL